MDRDEYRVLTASERAALMRLAAGPVRCNRRAVSAELVHAPRCDAATLALIYQGLAFDHDHHARARSLGACVMRAVTEAGTFERRSMRIKGQPYTHVVVCEGANGYGVVGQPGYIEPRQYDHPKPATWHISEGYAVAEAAKLTHLLGVRVVAILRWESTP